MVQRPSAQQATGSSGSSGVEVTRRDRHWGKQLTEGTVLEALRAYADNGEAGATVEAAISWLNPY